MGRGNAGWRDESGCVCLRVDVSRTITSSTSRRACRAPRRPPPRRSGKSLHIHSYCSPLEVRVGESKSEKRQHGWRFEANLHATTQPRDTVNPTACEQECVSPSDPSFVPWSSLSSCTPCCHAPASWRPSLGGFLMYHVYLTPSLCAASPSVTRCYG